MPFLVYLAVLLVAASSALFGLDLLTSPLPDKTQAARTESAFTSPPGGTSNSQKEQKEAKAEERAKERAKDDRALSPVYPAAPGANKDVRMVYPPTNETTGSAVADQSAPQTRQAADANQAAKPAEPTDPAEPATEVASKQAQEPPPAKAGEPAEPRVVQSPVRPVAERSGGRCNIAACAAAYNSFRSSDCTYQPYSGPRQVCEKGGVGRTASTRNRSSGEQRAQRSERGQYDSVRSRAVDLDDVAERVRRITSNDDDAGDDIDAPPVSRSRVIVIERGYGWR